MRMLWAMFCPKRWLPETPIGSKWEFAFLGGNLPFEPRLAITVQEVRDGWVKFSMPSGLSDTIKLRGFHYCYRPFRD